jgi:hypothetical protein
VSTDAAASTGAGASATPPSTAAAPRPYTSTSFENVATNTLPSATVGGVYLAKLASAFAGLRLESNSFEVRSSALNAYRMPGCALPSPGLSVACVAHTIPVPAVEPFADSDRKPPCGSLVGLSFDLLTGVVTNRPFVPCDRSNENASSGVLPGQTYMRGPAGLSHHTGAPTSQLPAEWLKRWTICGGASGKGLALNPPMLSLLST